MQKSTAQVRLFQDIDVGDELRAMQDRGVQALDVGKMEPARAFFAKVFGTTIEVGGKRYVVGTRSVGEFLERNKVKVDGEGVHAMVASLKSYYGQKVVGTAGNAFLLRKNVSMSVSQLHAALRVLGIQEALDLKSMVGKNGDIELTREQLFEALAGVINQIDVTAAPSEFQKFALLLKESITAGKVASAASDEVEAMVEEKVKELKGIDSSARMAEVVKRGMMAGVTDVESATDLLQQVIENVDTKYFDENHVGDLKLVLQNHRETLNSPETKLAYDALIGFLGFTVDKSGAVREPEK